MEIPKKEWRVRGRDEEIQGKGGLGGTPAPANLRRSTWMRCPADALICIARSDLERQSFS